MDHARRTIRRVQMQVQGGGGGDDEKTRTASLPEEKLKLAILLKVFVYKTMNNLGKLASIWATVVLLGGFSTLVKPIDFWYVSVIAFVLSIGILGGYEDPAHQILVRAPDALTKYKRAVAGEHWRRRPRKHQQEQDRDKKRRRAGSDSHRMLLDREDKLWGTAECRGLLGTVILVALKLAQFAAVTACIYLSSHRLRKHDFVDPQFQGKDDHRNVKRSMYIFYGLVLAQGILFVVLLLLMDPLLNYYMTRVRTMYRLLGPSGRDILVRYTSDNYMAFITGKVRSTLNTDLVAFAKMLVMSDSINDQLLGIWAIDYILRGSVGEDRRRLALMKLRASMDSDALGKLVGMLGLIRATEEQDIRGQHAARVVLKLAPGLLVENLPQILYYTSLLLNINPPCNKKKAMTMADMDLVWFGLRILDKLLDNPEKCSQAAKDDHADLLLSQIIDLTNLCCHGCSSTVSNRTYDSWIEEDVIPSLQQRQDIPPCFKNKIDQEAIVGMSFKVLSKLLAAPGAAGRDFRTKTSKSVQFLIHAGMIMGHVEATRVIACLALDDAARAVIGSSPEIINKLKDCLLSKTPHVNITKMAAKLYVLEETGSPQLSKIQSFIAESHRDQNLLPPLSAVIEELDLEPQLSSPWVQSFIQALDLEDVLSAPRVDHSEAAFEALVTLLAADAAQAKKSDCQENISAAVLEQINPEELKIVVKILYVKEDGENRRSMTATLQGCNLDPEMSQIVMKIANAEDGGHKRSMAAKLLQNLRAFSGAKCFNRHMDVIDQELPKVLRSIVDEVVKLEDPASTCGNLANMHGEVGIKEGKLLSSFIGLTLQICTSQNPNTVDFTRALEGANLTAGTFVQKLNRILQMCKSPTIEFPEIRRSTLQLMTWMVENNSRCIEILLQCGVYEQLKQVAKASWKLESFELFYCGVGVDEHGTSIPALARALQAQLELSPNFQERSHGIEQAGTITVLLA